MTAKVCGPAKIDAATAVGGKREKLFSDFPENAFILFRLIIRARRSTDYFFAMLDVEGRSESDPRKARRSIPSQRLLVLVCDNWAVEHRA